STPTPGNSLTRRKVVARLHGCGRRNDPALVEQILRDLHTKNLRQPAPVELALGQAVLALLAVLTGMHAAVDQLENALAVQFDQHPLAPVLRSAPGLGPLLGARLLAEIGDDPARFSTPGGLRAFAGTAPVTRASGRSRLVRARHIRNKRLADACHWWAFAMLTRSAGARAQYDRRRQVGDHHNAALRNLANKLLGRLWWCLQHHELWDDAAAWPHLQPGAPEAAGAVAA
ncbi:transposase, partial [Aeromicrobium sp.]|uniref:transposase n=1 Tax=Aeromicrobium sp. TaxID=1871063 RepID=UPI0019A5A39F